MRKCEERTPERPPLRITNYFKRWPIRIVNRLRKVHRIGGQFAARATDYLPSLAADCGKQPLCHRAWILQHLIGFPQSKPCGIDHIAGTVPIKSRSSSSTPQQYGQFLHESPLSLCIAAAGVDGNIGNRPLAEGMDSHRERPAIGTCRGLAHRPFLDKDAIAQVSDIVCGPR